MLFQSGATKKALASIQWAVDHLPGDFFYASTLDYTLVNVPQVVKTVTSLVPVSAPYDHAVRFLTKTGASVISSQEQSVFCLERLYEDRTVVKQKFRSNRLFEHYYSADMWPPHCSSGLYLMPMALACDLYDTSRTTLDLLPPSTHNILISGVLRRKIQRADNNIVGPSNDGSTFVQRFRALERGDEETERSNRAIKMAKIRWKSWIHQSDGFDA